MAIDIGKIGQVGGPSQAEIDAFATSVVEILDAGGKISSSGEGLMTADLTTETITTRLATATQPINTQITGLTSRVTSVETNQTTGRILAPTWTSLLATPGTATGQAGEVLDTDVGTHSGIQTGSDVDATIPNSGVYRWEASLSKWRRISASSVAGKQNSATASFIGGNKLKDPKFDLAIPGIITPNGGGGFTPPLAGLPNYYISKSGAAGIVFPEITLVTDQYNPLSKSKRALRTRQIRSTSGTVSTDAQVKQIIPIPAELWGQTNIEVRFGYIYKRMDVLIQLQGTVEVSANASLSPILTAPTITKLTTDAAAGEWAVALFTAILTDPTARYISVGSRLRTTAAGLGEGGGTSDIDAFAYLSATFCDFNRADVYSWEPNRLEEAQRYIESAYPALINPWTIGDNAIKNALVTGATQNAGGQQQGAPEEFIVASGGANTIGSVFSVATFLTPLGTNKAFRTEHYNNGTIRTDRQLTQIIDIPEYLWGNTGLVARVAHYVHRSHDWVDMTVLGIPMNAANTSLTSQSGTRRTPVGAIGAWELVVWDIPVPDATSRKLDIRFRSAANQSSGVVTGGVAYQTGFYLGWNKGEGTQGYDRNFDYDVKKIVLESVPSDTATLGTRVTAAETSITGINTVIQKPWMYGDNVIKNALLKQDSVGTTVPTGYLIATGGANTTGGNWQISKRTTPFGTGNVFQVDHYNNGTVRTDRQLQQIIDIPEDLWGNTTATLRVVFYTNTTTTQIGASIAASVLDAGGNFITQAAVTSVGTSAINTWYPVYANVPITSATARKINISYRLQVSGSSGVISGETSYSTGFYAGWYKADSHRYFDRNLNDEMSTLVKTEIATAIPTITGSLKSTDTWVDARGNTNLILPDTRIVTWGDSMTDGVTPSIASVMSSRTVVNRGIGGETSIQIANRARGHIVNLTGLSFAASGTKRLKAKRVVPPREIDEAYRAQWTSYGARIAEPRKVEFFNATGRIGTSYNQLTATATIAGDTLTATGHPFVNGDEIYVLNSTLPSNMYQYKVYFVRDVTANTFKLAEFSAGAAIVFNTFGGSITVLGQFYLDWAFTTGMDSNITTVSHTDIDTSVTHICIGVNNINQPDQIIADIRSIVESIKTFAKRFVISTCPAQESWTTGTTEFNNRVLVHDFITKEYPLNHIDIYGILRANGNNSTNDNADIAAGIVPRSLRVDTVHLNSAGNTLWANAINTFLTNKGW